MATRTLYAGQLATITTNVGGAGSTYYFPVSTASCEVSRPIEFLNTLGRIGTATVSQNNFTTCKSDVKIYLVSGAAAANSLNAAAIQNLTGDAVKGQKTLISVTPNGFTMSGIITSLGIEASFGNYATADLSFNGLGEPFFESGAAGTTLPADQANSPTGFTPVVSTNIALPNGVGCANSFRFNLDLPNEPLACLGDPVTGPQGAITNSVLVVKFPLKATIALEGYGVDASNFGETQTSGNYIGAIVNGSAKYNIGGLNIQLQNPKVTSKSFNQAVGNVGATYNVGLEDVFALFS